MILFNKIFLLSIISFYTFSCFSQGDMEKYIPYAGSSYDFYPIIEINTVIHIVKRSEQDAQNFNEDSLAFIKQQFEWINTFYDKLAKPILRTSDSIEHYIPSSRIRFSIDTILFYTDADDWDRIKSIENKKSPVSIIMVDTLKKQIIASGNWKNRMFRADDSIKVETPGGGYLTLNYNKTNVINDETYFTITSDFNADSIGNQFTYFIEENRNCSLDLWNKYTGADREALHVFYTGSSKSRVAFGCGPEPFYLNVSNLIKGGGWAGAQLTAHELGHTLGLSHTNFPQFDDLPKHDKFGFIGCNDSLTSNNIMGYNMCRNYLSPKQVAHVHKLYSTKQDRIRLTNANDYLSDNPIEIWSDTTWSKAMVVRKDIVIRRGQTLTLTNQLHMAAGATIYLESKTKLVIDGAVVSNFFDTKWQGVYVCKRFENKEKMPCKSKNYGQVVLLNRGTFENSISGIP